MASLGIFNKITQTISAMNNIAISMLDNPRPSFEQTYMMIAKILSLRSTCNRIKVGVVITTDDYREIISVGYNGNATGLANCCDRDEPGNCGCIHAEDNAIAKSRHPRECSKVLFVTLLPCPACAKRIINYGGVKIVYYLDDYKNKDAILLLNASNIQIVKISLQGMS